VGGIEMVAVDKKEVNSYLVMWWMTLNRTRAARARAMTMAATSALKARRVVVVAAVRGVWRDMEETPVLNQMD
jgi:hypothetical protein